MKSGDFNSEIRRIARDALWNETELLGVALDFIADTENAEAFRESLRGSVEERSCSDTVEHDRKIYALVTSGGTAAAETALCEKCGPEHKFTIEQAASGDVKGSDWKDCTGNEELSCVVCGYPEREWEVDVVRTGYGNTAIKVRARTERQAAENALDVAGNYSYSEHASDYDVNSVEAIA